MPECAHQLPLNILFYFGIWSAAYVMYVGGFYKGKNWDQYIEGCIDGKKQVQYIYGVYRGGIFRINF